MKTPAITPISQEFDFKTVPSWYVLCTNNACPLRQDCMRFHAGSQAPDSLESAHCVMPNTLKDGETLHTDPLTLESTWTSANGKYLNLSLLVKTGVEEGLDARQTLGIVISNVTELGDGTHHYDLVFYHHQNGVPEYYTTRVYSSIPTSFFKSGDTATLTIHTYQGTVVKDYQF